MHLRAITSSEGICCPFLLTTGIQPRQCGDRKRKYLIQQPYSSCTCCFLRIGDEFAPNQSFVIALFYGGVHLKIVGYSGGEVECLDM